MCISAEGQAEMLLAEQGDKEEQPARARGLWVGHAGPGVPIKLSEQRTVFFPFLGHPHISVGALMGAGCPPPPPRPAGPQGRSSRECLA